MKVVAGNRRSPLDPKRKASALMVGCCFVFVLSSLVVTVSSSSVMVANNDPRISSNNRNGAHTNTNNNSNTNNNNNNSNKHVRRRRTGGELRRRTAAGRDLLEIEAIKINEDESSTSNTRLLGMSVKQHAKVASLAERLLLQQDTTPTHRQGTGLLMRTSSSRISSSSRFHDPNWADQVNHQTKLDAMNVMFYDADSLSAIVDGRQGDADGNKDFYYSMSMEPVRVSDYSVTRHT